MNEYFARLLDVVEAYNGDVVCFAGDALMVVFDEENASEAARLATYCCLQLITEESPYTCSDGTILRLHATVASGMLTTVDLGTGKRRMGQRTHRHGALHGAARHGKRDVVCACGQACERRAWTWCNR
jgi:class 3 adenylate cyclase